MKTSSPSFKTCSESPIPKVPTLLILAGGTGGHIFPALAVAEELHAQGWRIVWLGTRTGLESKLVPPYGFTMQYIDFAGLRGKGALAKLQLPIRLFRACRQSLGVLKRIQPDVVLGMGGYISFPAGVMAALTRRAFILHEQNAIAGLANRLLAFITRHVLTAFPHVLRHAHCIGNPLRTAFLHIEDPKTRYAQRSGPLQILIAGGSLGATALNEIVPAALALLPQDQRPRVVHQAGQKHLDTLRMHYEQAGLLTKEEEVGSTHSPLASPTLLPFIDDISQAYAQADLVICRSGAMTVAEIAAVGVAALFVPFPHAVDDHQTHNAAFLVEHKAAHMIPQSALSAAALATWLSEQTRDKLLEMAMRARACAMPDAAQQAAKVCTDLYEKTMSKQSLTPNAPQIHPSSTQDGANL